MELDAVTAATSRPWRPWSSSTRPTPVKDTGGGTMFSTGGRQGGEGWWSPSTWMALCRHCGGKHLHKDCPKAP
eukprot:9120952-Heterocapsa_arctica.AAC.1